MAQPSNMRLKLLIDTKEQRVLFGEADKNFIDFLFNLLSLPLGTVIRVLKNQTMVGSLGNVYESVQTLSDIYMLPGQNKDVLLKPKASICCSMSILLPDIVTKSSTTAKTLFVCPNTYTNCRYSVSDGDNAICPSCKYYMKTVGTYVKPYGHCDDHCESENSTMPQPSSGKDGSGFVKSAVSYMVMDDLSVNPMSTVSGVTLLNKFNIKDLGALEEKLITLNVNGGVKLLKASLQSNTVLTDVFLRRIPSTLKTVSKGKKITPKALSTTRGKKRKSRK